MTIAPEPESENIHQRLQRVLQQHVITAKFKIKDVNFYPEVVIMVQKDDPVEKLKRLRKDLLKIGFQFNLAEIDKKDVPLIISEGKAEMIQQLQTSKSQSSNSAENLVDYIDIKNYNVKFSFFSLGLSLINPQKYKELNPARGGPMIKKSIFPESAGSVFLTITTAIIAVAIIGWWTWAVAYNYNEETTSLFTYEFKEGEGIVFNIFYFMLAVSCYFLVRELCHYWVVRIKKIPFTPSYFIGIEDLSNKNGRPNHQFDLAAVRLIAGFVFSIVLLFVGFYLSKIYTTGSLGVDEEDFGESLNRYNLLTLLIQYVFFPDNSVLFNFLSWNSIPTTVIIMHPIAYAGFFTSLLTLFTTIPSSFVDGGKMLYAALRKSTILCATSVIMGIGLAILFASPLAVMFVAMLGVYGTTAKTVTFENTQYYMYSLSKRRKIIGLVIIILICVLLFPLSPHMNFEGFTF